MTRKYSAAVLLMALSLLAFSAGGCNQQPAAHVENPLHVAVSDQELIRYHVADLLQEMFFVVEHPPRTPQRVDTRPLTSAHWFECWRDDTRTCRDVAENAIHTIRRRVAVNLAPAAAEGGGTEIEVVVIKERLSLPESVDATNMTELYSVYQTRIGVVEDLEEDFRHDAVWEDLGRDPALEQYILKQLSERI